MHVCLLLTWFVFLFVHYAYSKLKCTHYLFGITHKKAFNYATGGSDSCCFRILNVYSNLQGFCATAYSNIRNEMIVSTHSVSFIYSLMSFSACRMAHPLARRRNPLFFILEAAIFHSYAVSFHVLQVVTIFAAVLPWNSFVHYHNFYGLYDIRMRMWPI